MQAVVIILSDDNLDVDSFAKELGSKMIKKGVECQLTCVHTNRVAELLLVDSISGSGEKVVKEDPLKYTDEWILINVPVIFSNYIKASVDVTEWITNYIKLKDYERDDAFRKFLTYSEKEIYRFIDFSKEYLYSKRVSPAVHNLHTSLNLIRNLNGKII